MVQSSRARRERVHVGASNPQRLSSGDIEVGIGEMVTVSMSSIGEEPGSGILSDLGIRLHAAPRMAGTVTALKEDIATVALKGIGRRCPEYPVQFSTKIGSTRIEAGRGTVL